MAGIDQRRSCQVDATSPVQCAVYAPEPMYVDLPRTNSRFRPQNSRNQTVCTPGAAEAALNAVARSGRRYCRTP